MIKTDHMTYCFPLRYIVNIIEKEILKTFIYRMNDSKSTNAANNQIFLKYKFKTETTNPETFHPETP